MMPMKLMDRRYSQKSGKKISTGTKPNLKKNAIREKKKLAIFDLLQSVGDFRDDHHFCKE